MRIAITGARNINPANRRLIEKVLTEIITSRNDIEAIIFGGASRTARKLGKEIKEIQLF